MIEYQIKYMCRDTRTDEKIVFVDRYMRASDRSKPPINDVVTYIIHSCLTRKEYGFEFIEIVSIEKIPTIGQDW